MSAFVPATHELVVLKNDMIVGVSGVAGSFSEQAAHVYLERENVPWKCMQYLVTADEVLTALGRGEIDLAVFPCANSSIIVIRELIDVMSRHPFKVRDLERDIFSIPVHHHLLVKPGVTRRDVHVIVSQQPALDQCKNYLAQKWAMVVKRPHEDTAQAARDLSIGRLNGDVAVIASEKAAEAHGLEILEREIQDAPDNATYFIAAVRRE